LLLLLLRSTGTELRRAALELVLLRVLLLVLRRALELVLRATLQLVLTTQLLLTAELVLAALHAGATLQLVLRRALELMLAAHAGTKLLRSSHGVLLRSTGTELLRSTRTELLRAAGTELLRAALHRVLAALHPLRATHLGRRRNRSRPGYGCRDGCVGTLALLALLSLLLTLCGGTCRRREFRSQILVFPEKSSQFALDFVEERIYLVLVIALTETDGRELLVTHVFGGQRHLFTST
jgi:hypothetical protein